MSTRSSDLANQFNQLSQEFISTIDDFTPAQLKLICAGEQCTVAALAAHVAGIHVTATQFIETAAAGRPLPEITMSMVDEGNAAQFERDANRSKDDVLVALRQNGAQATRVVRDLTDANLDRKQYFKLFDAEVTTEDLVRNVLIHDIQEHLGSVKKVAAIPVAQS